MRTFFFGIFLQLSEEDDEGSKNPSQGESLASLTGIQRAPPPQNAECFEEEKEEEEEEVVEVEEQHPSRYTTSSSRGQVRFSPLCNFLKDQQKWLHVRSSSLQVRIGPRHSLLHCKFLIARRRRGASGAARQRRRRRRTKGARRTAEE